MSLERAGVECAGAKHASEVDPEEVLKQLEAMDSKEFEHQVSQFEFVYRECQSISRIRKMQEQIQLLVDPMTHADIVLFGNEILAHIFVNGSISLHRVLLPQVRMRVAVFTLLLLDERNNVIPMFETDMTDSIYRIYVISKALSIVAHQLSEPLDMVNRLLYHVAVKKTLYDLDQFIRTIKGYDFVSNRPTLEYCNQLMRALNYNMQLLNNMPFLAVMGYDHHVKAYNSLIALANRALVDDYRRVLPILSRLPTF